MFRTTKTVYSSFSVISETLENSKLDLSAEVSRAWMRVREQSHGWILHAN